MCEQFNSHYSSTLWWVFSIFCLVTKITTYVTKNYLENLSKNREKNGKKLQNLVIIKNVLCALVINKIKTLPLPDKFWWKQTIVFICNVVNNIFSLFLLFWNEIYDNIFTFRPWGKDILVAKSFLKYCNILGTSIMFKSR